MKKITSLSVLAALLIGAFALVLGPGAGVARADTGMAHVRVVHAAPAAPNVDVYVDGTKLLPAFAFGTVTDYVMIAAGSHKIDIVGVNAPITPAVIEQTVTVEANKAYTVAAIGNSSPAVTPALVAFVDDNSVSNNTAKVRVYHLSDNAGPVAVATGGNTVIPSLAFQNASGYLNVPAGTYSFNVTLLNSSTVVPLNGAQLDANKVTSVFALGEVGGTGATVFKFVPKAVAGVPTTLPVTGYVAPATNGIPAYVWAALAVVAALFIGSITVAYTRRNAR